MTVDLAAYKIRPSLKANPLILFVLADYKNLTAFPCGRGIRAELPYSLALYLWFVNCATPLGTAVEACALMPFFFAVEDTGVPPSAFVSNTWDDGPPVKVFWLYLLPYIL